MVKQVVHEAAIAQNLLEIIEREARAHGGKRVTRIHVRIGRFSCVVPDALRFAFEVMSQGGIAEKAIIEVEEVPLMIQCHHCQETIVMDEPFMVCPSCQSTDVMMIAGRELELTSLEIEDGNQGSQEYT